MKEAEINDIVSLTSHVCQSVAQVRASLRDATMTFQAAQKVGAVLTSIEQQAAAIEEIVMPADGGYRAVSPSG